MRTHVKALILYPGIVCRNAKRKMKCFNQHVICPFEAKKERQSDFTCMFDFIFGPGLFFIDIEYAGEI